MFRWNLVPKGAEMKKENFTMKELPDSEKPYEKCERDGAKSLSNAELLAVILKSGTRIRRVLPSLWKC